ncbi:hypothetical protein LCGC14_1146590 [marine sediment metagenome]|uniref:Uncharacterized protein n=1 Tax=marine sediment metagenome TaxID=412755 RepID=A0A0F9PEV4_9ZZZZ
MNIYQNVGKMIGEAMARKQDEKVEKLFDYMEKNHTGILQSSQLINNCYRIWNGLVPDEEGEYEPYYQRAPKTGDKLYDADVVVDEER